jgi:hypothetical protein
MKDNGKGKWRSAMLYTLPLLPIPASFVLPEEYPCPNIGTVIIVSTLAALALVACFRLVFIEKMSFRPAYLALFLVYGFGIIAHIAMSVLNARSMK